MSTSRRMPLVANRLILRMDDCRRLGVEYQRDAVRKTAQSVIGYSAGRVVLIADAKASRGEILRSLRLIKEEVALDEYLSLEPKSRAIWLDKSKLKRKPTHNKVELPD